VVQSQTHRLQDAYCVSVSDAQIAACLLCLSLELVESVKETVDVFNVTLVAGRTNWRMLTGLALPFVKRLMNRKGINPVKDFEERGKSKK